MSREKASYRSWGRYPAGRSDRVIPLAWRDEPLPALEHSSCLAHGNGRSYGDSCLNDGATLLGTRGLDRICDFDPATGDFECEPGLLLEDLLELMLPHGWFAPVVPGTRYVTIGGAVANDIHGKNHHLLGSFGAHVRSLELLRSDGSRLRCSPTEHADLFRATIGGLGLTGLITRVRMRLKPVRSGDIEQETTPFGGLQEFFELCRETEERFEHTVAWIDCLASGRSLGRGVMICGNHADDESTRRPPRGVLRSVPAAPPFSLVNGLSIRTFNALFYRRHALASGRSRVHHRTFFFPLDGIRNWNRIYGRRGFMQYQCVVPPDAGPEAIGDMLRLIARRRTGSFLAVLKRFGTHERRGLLSFARPGVTLALDFPNRGERTLALLEELDGITRACRGAVYCAKDARMSPESFRAYYPEWAELEALRDPAFDSSFWRRVTESSS